MGPVVFLSAIGLIFLVAAIHYLITRRSDAAAAEQPTNRSVADFFRSLSAAVAMGWLLGLLVGGVGGRLAMRLLFLTSPSSVRGVTSDDGFEIGRFDIVDTLLFLGAMSMIGVIGGIGYLAIRRWLPEVRWQRSLLCAAGGATVVGSSLVHQGGVDFTLLEPRWLAVAVFVLIPAAFGALIPLLVDARDGSDSWFRRAPLRFALAPLLLMAPVALIAGGPVLIAALLWLAAARRGELLALWESPQLFWAGRLAIGLVGGLASYALFNDVRAVL